MISLKVTGMTCGHCEMAVRKALENVEGVDRVLEVSHQKGLASVEGAPDSAKLIAAIVEEGYQAEVAP